MPKYFPELSEALVKKAEQIKLIITDVDGVLTDGGIIYDDNGLEYKRFNVKDGFIIGHLKKSGILVGALTARNSKVVEYRCEELNFDFHYHGVKDKLKKLDEILDVLEIDASEVAYIGDDLIDIPLMKKVGFSASPSDAIPYVSNQVDFVSRYSGGQGAFREISDLILDSKGLLTSIIEKYVQ
ncbi:KdsC family phosphatase [Shivajiella indica]|uniref:KdsC family phosphatase n=1 Tax=Shivajiella indica TaxID=872115 RepID=A0ABW5B6T4_9BACT